MRSVNVDVVEGCSCDQVVGGSGVASEFRRSDVDRKATRVHRTTTAGRRRAEEAGCLLTRLTGRQATIHDSSEVDRRIRQLAH